METTGSYESGQFPKEGKEKLTNFQKKLTKGSNLIHFHHD